jgi:hypothetical protein
MYQQSGQVLEWQTQSFGRGCAMTSTDLFYLTVRQISDQRLLDEPVLAYRSMFVPVLGQRLLNEPNLARLWDEFWLRGVVT